MPPRRGLISHGVRFYKYVTPLALGHGIVPVADP